MPGYHDARAGDRREQYRPQHRDRDGPARGQSASDADTGSSGPARGLRVCVQCNGRGQRFESQAMLRRHRNSGRMSRGNALTCRGAAPSVPHLSAGPVWHRGRLSTGPGGHKMDQSSCDMAGLDSDDNSAQQYVPPSMQVHTSAPLCCIAFENSKINIKNAHIMTVKNICAHLIYFVRTETFETKCILRVHIL